MYLLNPLAIRLFKLSVIYTKVTAPCWPYVRKGVPPQKWTVSWAIALCYNSSLFTWV